MFPAKMQVKFVFSAVDITSKHLYRKILLISLMCFITFLCPAEDYSLEVPKGIVYADPGEDVILPVHLSPETSAVFMTVRWFRDSELIYQYKNGQEITDGDYENRACLSIQELERGNISLTLRNFVPSDSGKFTCKVFHDGCLQTGIVHLQGKILVYLQLHIHYGILKFEFFHI